MEIFGYFLIFLLILIIFYNIYLLNKDIEEFHDIDKDLDDFYRNK